MSAFGDPLSTRASNSHVTVRLTPSRGGVLDGVSNEVDVMVEIETVPPPETKTTRPGIDLCVVLDKSGSMQGQKLVDAKRAISAMIGGMTAKDRLSLVTFASDNRVNFEGLTIDQKDVILRKVDEIGWGGGTNLYDALVLGGSLLEKSFNKEHISKLFLLSDGHANEGVTDHERIFAVASELAGKGILVNSFGVGDDFDEKLMLGIANHGKGEYFFIHQNADFTRIMNLAFEGAANLFATQATLTVRGVGGSIVKQAIGHDPKVLIDGISMGDLQYGDRSRLFLRVSVPASIAAATYDLSELLSAKIPVLAQPMLKCQLEYMFQDAKVQLEANLAIPVLESQAEVQKLGNPHVEELVRIQLASATTEKATELLKQGRNDEARQVVQEQINMYDQAQQQVHCAEGTLCHEDSKTKSRRARQLMESVEDVRLSQNAKIKTSSFVDYNSNSRFMSLHRDEL